jgi:hypothetical protein
MDQVEVDPTDVLVVNRIIDLPQPRMGKTSGKAERFQQEQDEINGDEGEEQG